MSASQEAVLAARVVRWVAVELIYLGQCLIRTAYIWLQWAERQEGAQS
jgi:hypothetical protein